MYTEIFREETENIEHCKFQPVNEIKYPPNQFERKSKIESTYERLILFDPCADVMIKFHQTVNYLPIQKNSRPFSIPRFLLYLLPEAAQQPSKPSNKKRHYKKNPKPYIKRLKIQINGISNPNPSEKFLICSCNIQIDRIETCSGSNV